MDSSTNTYTTGSSEVYSIYIYPPDDMSETVRNNIIKFGKNFCFTKLTNEHLTKLILMQKINKSVNRNTRIIINLHTDIELDDFSDTLHPKIINILKYTSEDYNISIINL
jgi:hypothetical protein